MAFHAVCFLLLSGVLQLFSSTQVNAAPVTYNRQQTGDINVDAKLENFLMIVGTSADTHMFSNLALEALDELMKQRSPEIPEKSPEMTIYETESSYSGREPYRVEIVRLNEGETARNSSADGSEKIESSKFDDIEKGSQEATDDKTVAKRARSLWGDRDLRKVKITTDIKNSQKENYDVKATRPGISLKKQLSKKEEQDASEEKNELGNKYKDQLVLIGDGIENCGPGRIRDNQGLCQDDEEFNKKYNIHNS